VFSHGAVTHHSALRRYSRVIELFVRSSRSLSQFLDGNSNLGVVLWHDEDTTAHERRRWNRTFSTGIRPVVEQALRDGNRRKWPHVTLNVGFKTEEPGHRRAIWELLTRCTVV